MLRVQDELRPLRDPVLIAGFAGQMGGGTAAAAVQYLAEQWDATVVAELDPDECFDYTVRRPITRIVDGQRVVDFPTNELYVVSPAGLDRDFVLLPGIEPHMRWRGFVEALTEALQALGCRQAVLLQSRAGAVPHTRPAPLRLSGSRSGELARAFGMEASASRYEGPAGINAVVACGLEAAGIEVVSLSVMLPFYVAAEPNAHGVRALVQAVDGAFGTSTLVSQLEFAEAQLDELTAQGVAASEQLAASVASMEQQYDWIRGGAMPKQLAAPLPELPKAEEVVADLERMLREARGSGAHGGE